MVENVILFVRSGMVTLFIDTNGHFFNYRCRNYKAFFTIAEMCDKKILNHSGENYSTTISFVKCSSPLFTFRK
jgi:hypothetical protein